MSLINMALERPFALLLTEQKPVSVTALGQAAATFVMAYAVDCGLISTEVAVQMINRFLADPVVRGTPQLTEAWRSLRDEIADTPS